MKRFVICTLHKVLLGGSSPEGEDGRDM